MSFIQTLWQHDVLHMNSFLSGPRTTQPAAIQYRPCLCVVHYFLFLSRPKTESLSIVVF
jgi:hypothetical protein